MVMVLDIWDGSRRGGHVPVSHSFTGSGYLFLTDGGGGYVFIFLASCVLPCVTWYGDFVTGIGGGCHPVPAPIEAVEVDMHR